LKIYRQEKNSLQEKKTFELHFKVHYDGYKVDELLKEERKHLPTQQGRQPR
jgi:hypothetical protein